MIQKLLKPCISALALGMSVFGPALAAPPELSLVPNSLQTRDRPMEVRLHGDKGQVLLLLFLRGCNNDQTEPGMPDGKGCTPVEKPRRKVLTGDADRDREVVDFKDWPRDLDGKRLWLRVLLEGEPQKYRDAVFTLMGDYCGVWASVRDLVKGGTCDPKLARAFNAVRGLGDGVPVEPLEVRRVDPRKEGEEPVAVPGTTGATGVAWQGTRALLVTLRGDEGGLYLVDLAGGSRKLLLKAASGTHLLAPLALADGGVALVRERDRTVPGEDVAAVLLWRGGKVRAEVPLRRSVHQLLRSDAAGQRVLAYSLYEGRPALLKVNLKAGGMTELEAEECLLREALRQPGGQMAVLAYQDAGNEDGWDIDLYQGQKLLRALAAGPGHDLLPAWRPDGTELAYLAQMNDRRAH